MFTFFLHYLSLLITNCYVQGCFLWRLNTSPCEGRTPLAALIIVESGRKMLNLLVVLSSVASSLPSAMAPVAHSRMLFTTHSFLRGYKKNHVKEEETLLLGANSLILTLISQGIWKHCLEIFYHIRRINHKKYSFPCKKDVI